jgi:hypothetical protein
MTDRSFTITRIDPPGPTTALDWEYVADDYDGPGDPRCGLAGSEEEARERVDELWEEASACD